MIPRELSAAWRLEGLALEGGWQVRGLRPVPTGASGGNFSVAYTVVDARGHEAFLKALDISRAIRGRDLITALRELTEDYAFERDVLARCRGLDRVVANRAHGFAMVDDTDLGRVPYLIFDLATGDIRQAMSTNGRPGDDHWCLRCLHHVATGLQQLHRRQVTHQDLKPSNVFLFEDVTKLGDLGRASCAAIPSRFDQSPFAGDPNYAPPEILYKGPMNDLARQRRATDLFMLGSMMVFLFAQTTLPAVLLARLPAEFSPRRMAGRFREVLPVLHKQFGEGLDLIEPQLGALRAEVRQLLTYLGEPDPELRGHPLNRGGFQDQYSVERFVARLDLLARRAALRR